MSAYRWPTAFTGRQLFIRCRLRRGQRCGSRVGQWLCLRTSRACRPRRTVFLPHSYAAAPAAVKSEIQGWPPRGTCEAETERHNITRRIRGSAFSKENMKERLCSKVIMHTRLKCKAETCFSLVGAQAPPISPHGSTHPNTTHSPGRKSLLAVRLRSWRER